MAGFPQSSIDWSKYMEGLQSKLNVDANNFSSIGKGNIPYLSMPSDRYTDLTVAASGLSYTAPANGYFVARNMTPVDGRGLCLQNTMNDVFSTSIDINGLTGASLIFPVRKGDSVKVYYNKSNGVDSFRFYYAEGSSGE